MTTTLATMFLNESLLPLFFVSLKKTNFFFPIKFDRWKKKKNSSKMSELLLDEIKGTIRSAAVGEPSSSSSVAAREDEDVRNAFSLLAAKGDVASVRSALHAGTHDCNQLDAQGYTALHWASMHGHHACVRLLLERGADANSCGAHGKSKHVKVHDDDAGKDNDASRNDGQTPVHWAAMKGRVLALAELLERGGGDIRQSDARGRDAFLHAVMAGQTLTAHYLASSDVDGGGGALVNGSRDDSGRSALHCAVIKGHAEMTQYLLAQGADVECRDSSGRTPLHHAALGSDGGAIARQLLASGASETVFDDAQRTPAQLAADARSRAHELFEAMSLLSRDRMFPPRVLPQRTQSFLFCMPSLALGVALLLFVLSPWWLFALGASFLWAVLVRAEYLFCPRNGSNPLTGAGYTFMNVGYIFVTFTGVLLPHYGADHALLMLVFYALTACMLYNFYRSVWGDPGFFRGEPLRRRTIVSLLADGTLTAANWCVTCTHLRPPRSKHCSACHRCVAKFDHHCGFVSNCVGAGNHVNFVAWLLSITACNAIYLTLCCAYLWSGVAPPAGQHVVDWVRWLIAEHPAMLFMTIFGAVHIAWLAALAGTQLLFAARNVTTNESINWRRYDYLQGSGACDSDASNVYDRGVVYNLLQFVEWSREHTIDWRQFHHHRRAEEV
jgi:palmitoyltransferase ZDHHC13/17